MHGSALTIRLTSIGRDLARAAVRRQQFAIGAPLEFDEAAPRGSNTIN